MKSTEPSKNLLGMEEKRTTLLDQCIRALCGDDTIDPSLLRDATGGRFDFKTGADEGEPIEDVIKTLILALRWLGLPIEKKTRRRRSTKGKTDPKGKTGTKGKTDTKGKNNGSTIPSKKRPTKEQTPPSDASTPAEQPSA